MNKYESLKVLIYFTNYLNQKILKMFEKVGMKYFFGDYFDARFYVSHILSQKHVDMLLDLGCGAGVLLNSANADLKIGLDASLEYLKKAKLLNPEMELIQADATHLPFKDNYFPNIISMHLITEICVLMGDDWIKAASEIKRVSKNNGELILTGANRMSKHFEKSHTLESRKKYLTYQNQIDFFKNEFSVEIEGYGPHSKYVMFPLKIFHKIPDTITNSLGLNLLLYKFLRSKRYLKNGRSYVIICNNHLKN